MRRNILGTPKTMIFESSHGMDSQGNYIGGTTRGLGLLIQWEGTQTRGVQPIDLIGAMLQHLQEVQKTRQACDANSRLVWYLTKAQEEYANAKGIGNGNLQSGRGSSGNADGPPEHSGGSPDGQQLNV